MSTHPLGAKPTCPLPRRPFLRRRVFRSHPHPLPPPLASCHCCDFGHLWTSRTYSPDMPRGLPTHAMPCHASATSAMCKRNPTKPTSSPPLVEHHKHLQENSLPLERCVSYHECTQASSNLSRASLASQELAGVATAAFFLASGQLQTPLLGRVQVKFSSPLASMCT